MDFPGIELVEVVLVEVVVELFELLGVLEEPLPVLAELVVCDVPPAVVEELLGPVLVLLVVGAVDEVLVVLAIGSHGTLLGVVLCGTGVAVCAGGVAVWGVGEAVWACGVAVCGVGDAVCAGGVAVWGVGDAVCADGVAVCAPADIIVTKSSKSKQVNTLILSFIRASSGIGNTSL